MDFPNSSISTQYERKSMSIFEMGRDFPALSDASHLINADELIFRNESGSFVPENSSLLITATTRSQDSSYPTNTHTATELPRTKRRRFVVFLFEI